MGVKGRRAGKSTVEREPEGWEKQEIVDIGMASGLFPLRISVHSLAVREWTAEFEDDLSWTTLTHILIRNKPCNEVLQTVVRGTNAH